MIVGPVPGLMSWVGPVWPIERLAWSAFSSLTSFRISGVTQTWSPTIASRQTKPVRQVFRPYGPLGFQRDATVAFSWRERSRDSGVTYTLSFGPANRSTNPRLH